MMKKIEKCRICAKKELKTILNLGDVYVSDFVDKVGQGIKAPLELVLCNKAEGGCGLLQLAHTVQPEKMYFQYWYRSGINESMRRALKDVTVKAEEAAQLKPGDSVLDIGCNDGTMLRSYDTKGLKLYGIDPARNLRQYSEQGTTKIITDFFNAAAIQREIPNAKFKVITAIAMFYDLDTPNIFVEDITRFLDKDGVFIIQMMSLPLMLKTTGFDNICHEHLEYYSLIALNNLLDRHGLQAFDVESNDVNGGSFRIYIRFKGTTVGNHIQGAKARVSAMLKEEADLGLNDLAVYVKFAEKIQKIKQEVRGFIAKEVASGKKVYVYGASTKGNTLLPVFGIDHKLVVAALERNTEKYGKLTVGTWIPIISEEEGRKAKPDYLFVLPWHFLEGFLQRERAYLESGGKFIVPLPEFRVISAADLK